GGSIFFAVLMVTTRMLRRTSDMVLIFGQVGATLLFGVALAPFGWITPSLRDFLLLSLFGVGSIVALACVNRSLKLAPASVVVPYQYTMIVWAVILGYLVFGDVPDLFTLGARRSLSPPAFTSSCVSRCTAGPNQRRFTTETAALSLQHLCNPFCDPSSSFSPPLMSADRFGPALA